MQVLSIHKHCFGTPHLFSKFTIAALYQRLWNINNFFYNFIVKVGGCIGTAKPNL